MQKTQCAVEYGSMEILYFLYGQLEDNDLHVDIDSFSRDEVYHNNNVLDQIIYKIEELRVGQEIVYDELDKFTLDAALVEAKELKGLQILGRKKWLRIVTGFLSEYGATKVLDELFKVSIVPMTISFYNHITTFLK